jgi:hypothetical protein
MIHLRRLAIATFVIMLAFAFSAKAQTTRPRVIIIVSDDQGYGDFSADAGVAGPAIRIQQSLA